MKIAILTPGFLTFDGVSRAVEDQAVELAQQRHSVSIFALDANMKPPQNVGLYLLGAPKSLLGQRMYRLFFPLDFMKAIKWLPKLKGFDIIYSHQYPMTWLAYLAKRFYGAKYIYYNHGIGWPGVFSSFVERTYMNVFALLANWTIARADGAISISRFMQQELKKETGLDSEVIYRKADARRFHPEVDGSRIRQKHNLNNTPIILYVGVVSPHKGIHLLLQAFRLVKREVPDARLLIVGKHTFNGYSKKLKQACDDSVIFTGDVPDEDLPQYYAACDVYATASLWEGFNLPLAEARACGKPVIAFRLCSHPEVVNDGESGILVKPNNVEEFAKGITKALQSKDEMGEKAAKWDEGFVRHSKGSG